MLVFGNDKNKDSFFFSNKYSSTVVDITKYKKNRHGVVGKRQFIAVEKNKKVCLLFLPFPLQLKLKIMGKFQQRGKTIDSVFFLKLEKGLLK